MTAGRVAVTLVAVSLCQDYRRNMKRQSFNIENHLHYITFSCYRRQALLSDEHTREALLNLWREAITLEELAIAAYVVMPNHAHILVKPPAQEYEVASILRRLKEPFSRWLVAHLRNVESGQLGRITTTVGGKRIHRVWQKGGGYDRNLYSQDAINRAIEYIEFNPVEAGFVNSPELWRWSSAFARRNPERCLLQVMPLDEVEKVS